MYVAFCIQRAGLVFIIVDMCAHDSTRSDTRRFLSASGFPCFILTGEPVSYIVVILGEAPLAQLDRVTAYEAVGCRFEPCRAHHLFRIIIDVEHAFSMTFDADAGCLFVAPQAENHDRSDTEIAPTRPGFV